MDRKPTLPKAMFFGFVDASVASLIWLAIHRTYLPDVPFTGGGVISSVIFGAAAAYLIGRCSGEIK